MNNRRRRAGLLRAAGAAGTQAGRHFYSWAPDGNGRNGSRRGRGRLAAARSPKGRTGEAVLAGDGGRGSLASGDEQKPDTSLRTQHEECVELRDIGPVWFSLVHNSRKKNFICMEY